MARPTIAYTHPSSLAALRAREEEASPLPASGPRNAAPPVAENAAAPVAKSVAAHVANNAAAPVANSAAAPVAKNDLRANGWLAWPASDANVQLRLFCFPYAGGAGAVFRPWRTQLPQGIDVCGIQLPGRGARMYERHYRRLNDVVPAIAEAILPLCDRPFAFFGHSLGALISFEVARYLRRKTGREPILLIASGRRAPQIQTDEAPIYALPHDAFVEELRRLNGTPEEVLLNAELMELLLPTLRADFELCDTYQFDPGERLTIPVTVYGGADDVDDTREKLEAWQSTTSGPFKLRMFPGGHFFLHTAESLLLRTLSADLQDAVTTLG